MSEEDTSLMDELTAAWEEHESEEVDALDAAPIDDVPVPETPQEAPVEAPVESPVDAPLEASAEPAAAPEPTVSEDEAPKGLSVGMRENWKNLDSQTKNEFKRYEERIGGMAQKYAHDARRAQAMDKVMQPYSQLMQMNGGPQNILPGLLQTGAALQTGNEVERARTVASLISQFQVNPAQVAGFLKGENPEPSQNEQIQQMINQKMAPVHQQLQQYQQRDQQMRQQGQEQIKGKIREFADANEFYGQLNESMADIMDIAARNGREMGLQEAYDAAAWQHPEIRKILIARQSQGQIQQRKRASSSIHGTPGGEGSSAAPGDLRSTLEQAFQTANRM
ncbi:MAG: hypothetical protein HN538_09905 [Alphaproteobacteria bacterium]|nr:hypothetical protein [Alphaproteobacteria bacterium]